MMLLGRGTYNVVFMAADGKTAIRLSGYPLNNERAGTIRMLKRGNAVLRIMATDYFGLLGPVLLQNVSELTMSETIPNDELRELLKEEAKKNNSSSLDYLLDLEKKSSPKMFYMNTMEMLQTLRVVNYGKYFAQTAFFLCWFLAMSQKRLKFSHRDIKYGNLGARAVPPGTNYCFALLNANDKALFCIQDCPFVPVLFDYDFASLDGITDDNEFPVRTVGTSSTTPPEVFCNALNNVKQGSPDPDSTKRTVPAIYFLDAAIDWWSIGATLFDLYVGNGNGIFNSRLLMNKDNPDYAKLSEPRKYLYNAYVLRRWILTNKMGLPVVYFERYPKVAKELTIDITLKKDKLLNKKNIQYYRAEFEKLSPPMQEFFRRILSFDPEERTFYGHPEKYLTELELFEPLRVEKFPNKVDWIYMSDKGAKERPDIQKYPALKQQSLE